MNANRTLERLLEPIGKCLSRRAAQALLDLRADEEAQNRIEYLAAQNTEGLLTNAECDEYAAYVSANNLIAILQAKARASLRQKRKKQ